MATSCGPGSRCGRSACGHESRVVGGVGPCGKELCCATFLTDFEPITVKMAKDQKLSLNPAKLSGVCGRLMCCLIYEHTSYAKPKCDAATPRSAPPRPPNRPAAGSGRPGGDEQRTDRGRGGHAVEGHVLHHHADLQRDDIPHIGHAYTPGACDAMARWNRMKGKRVFFLTGTDEHGEKIQKSAAQKGLEPKQLADQVVVNFQGLTPALTISNTGFIRTTEPRHYAAVHDLFRKSLANGDIYLGEYEGWYCVPDEAYWTDLQVEDGKCPTCGRPVERRKEPSYFFRLSKYQDRLLKFTRRTPASSGPKAGATR